MPNRQPTAPPLDDRASIMRRSTATLNERRVGPERSPAPQFGPSTDTPKIGRYVVLERIGAGGMGEVFSAFDDDLDRKIAIKVVHADIAEESTRAGARLVREAQTLAKISHNNVVHVYEVGTVRGRLYIAMEFIRGQTLRRWRADPRSYAEVIRVFIEAGKGLQAVHEAGLVHRDFKPENVLVGDDGRICVADFGLARSAGTATDEADEDDRPAESLLAERMDRPLSRLTASGAIIGTPAYMAPEQLRAHAIDARCDQFSFSVAMWEALADERPYPADSLPGLVEAHRSHAPEPPAGEVPAHIWKVLLRGLSTDPNERFETMGELLTALDPPVRRSRLNLLLGVGASAFLVGALVFSPQTDGPCEAVDPSWAQVWDDATATKVHAAVAAVPVSWANAAADELRAQLDSHASALLAERTAACRATHIDHTQSEARLDRRTACLDRVTARFASLTDTLLTATPQMIEHAGPATASLPHPTMCRGPALDTAMAPPSDGAAATQVAMARKGASDAWALLSVGQTTEASRAAQRLHDTYGALDYPPLDAEVAHLQGEIASSSDDPEGARKHLLTAVDLAEGNHHDVLAADAWLSLTRMSVADLRDPTLGRQWLRRARAAATRLGADPRRERTLMRHDADLDRLAGDLPKARDKLKALIDATDGRVTGDLLPALAGVLWAEGKLEDAYKLHERHRVELRDRLGSDHPLLGAPEFNLGALDVQLGRHTSARRHLGLALTLWSDAHGASYPRLAQVHMSLMQLDMETGELATAQAHANAAVSILGQSLPPDHPEVGLALQGLAMVAYLSDDFTEAVESYEAALEIQAAAMGPEHRTTAVVRANLAEALLANGATDRAIAQAGRALSDLAAAGVSPALVGFAQRVQGSAYLRSGKLDEAVAALHGARDRMRGQDGYALERGVLHTDLARALARSGKPDHAARMAIEARSILKAAGGEAPAALLAQFDREFPPTR